MSAGHGHAASFETLAPTEIGRSGPKLRALAGETLRRATRLAWQDRVFYLLVGIHALAAVALLVATGHRSALAFSAYFLVWPFVFFLQFPFVYALVGTFQVVHRFDDRRRLAFRRLFSPRRLSHFVSGLGLLLALMVFQGAFTSLKNVFPSWAGGFPYDTALADIDRTIHFGNDPWRILHGLGGGDMLRHVVEWNYDHGWFVLCYVTLFVVAVVPEAARIRTRYMLTYAATWIVVGNLLAGLLPAAGPAFFGHVTGDTSRFGPLVAMLAGDGPQPYSAAFLQEYLWSLYSSGQPGFGSGISAFPSMHVALVTMNAFFLWEWRRPAGTAAFAYVAVIAASSVYLAWHYAVDGYAAVAVTAAIYLGIRAVMRRMSAPPVTAS